ncbi:hypothetical protein F5Y10DRAFT_270957 [Nemania abortiva]|nr:hypothetical protein F5Y10DRAFT_270957 [Nemania abortiva]
MDEVKSAIGLAGAVLKLVLFTIDFISDAKQVYKQGATAHNIDLSTIAKSIEVTTTSLEKQLHTANESRLYENQVLDPDDERLKELARRAAEIGRELEQKLVLVTTNKGSKWKSFKSTISSMWNADDIQAIEQRLTSIKDEIQLSILVSIRNKVDQRHDEDESRLVSTLEELANQQTLSIEEGKLMIEMLNSVDKDSQGRHDELVQIGNQLLNGIAALSFVRPPLYDANAYGRAEEIILNSLWYPSIWDREETIAKAHAKTFQWIFEDPKTTEKPWDSFVEFLQGERSSFWITGKPASGKSTLMKYINKGSKTRVLLKQWSGKRDLIQISYYFYYNGSQFQKSELGLIRSLLYSILESRRKLIPIAFKGRFRAAVEGKKLDAPSLPEAKKALRDLISHNPNLCFFFSIDGLDEFDPAVSLSRVQSLIDFTHSFKESKNVKVLVSSRPLPEFERGYDGCASLRIHELTQEDIRQYTNERLMVHPRMKILDKKDPKNTRDLLQSIVDSSLGVFLWVRLVTESLIEGLTNYDNIGELKKRLEELPSDLEDLYRTMLSRVDSQYRSQSARLLCFIYHIHSRPEEELSLLDLWFAENADDEMVYKTEIESIEDEDVRDRVREIESQLKSRCRGLIETITFEYLWPIDRDKTVSMIYPLATEDHGATARFIHRSVYEFLGRPAVWDNVVGRYLGRSFSVTLSLFRSAILIIKTCQLTHAKHCNRILFFASHVGVRARLAEQETKQSYTGLVHELDEAMHGIMPIIRRTQNINLSGILNHTSHWSDWCRHVAANRIWSAEIYWAFNDGNFCSSLMAFAVEYGLQYYIRSQLSEKGREVLDKNGLPLLGYALIPFWNRRMHHYSNTETVKFLLDEGENPNQLHRGTTLCQVVVTTAGTGFLL